MSVPARSEKYSPLTQPAEGALRNLGAQGLAHLSGEECVHGTCRELVEGGVWLLANERQQHGKRVVRRWLGDEPLHQHPALSARVNLMPILTALPLKE
jgi:hypothetical protein